MLHEMEKKKDEYTSKMAKYWTAVLRIRSKAQKEYSKSNLD